MTISTTTRKSGPYTGNGATDEFTFDWKVFAGTDIDVTLTSTAGVETLKTITTHYTVALNADQNANPGGTVTMLTPPALNELVTITSDVPSTQNANILTNGGFSAVTNANAFDRVTILIQQLEEKQSRSITIPMSDSTGVSVELPTETLRASKACIFDADGNITVSTDDFEDQATAAAASASAASTAQTAAEAAQTAAETAQTGAETAETNAGTAQTAAEAAQTAAEAAQTAAEAAQTGAETAETNAEDIVTAVSLGFTFSTTTAMADPGTGIVRFNNATIASVTSMAFDALCADTGNPDVSDFLATWADSTNTVKGHILVRKEGAPGTFAIFTVSAVTDNTGWLEVTVAHVASNGALSDTDALRVAFTRAGDEGAAGAGSGDVTGPAGATDDAVARYDSTTGKLLQNSPVTISDAGVMSGVTQQNVDNVRIDGNTVSTTNTNGDLILAPDGTGEVQPDGNIDLQAANTIRMDVQAIGSIGGGTQDIDLTLGRFVTATVDTSTTTFTFSNPLATGHADFIVLKLTNGGSQTVNWPASVDWDGTAGAPTLTAAGVDDIIFITLDGGTIWTGYVAAQATA